MSEFELQGTAFDTTEYIERLIDFGKTYSEDPYSAIYEQIHFSDVLKLRPKPWLNGSCIVQFFEFLNTMNRKEILIVGIDFLGRIDHNQKDIGSKLKFEERFKDVDKYFKKIDILTGGYEYILFPT